MQAEHVSNPKKKWIVMGLIAIIIIIVGVNLMMSQNKNKVNTERLKFVTAQEKELSNTKLITGTVVPGNEEIIYADPARGKVGEIFVHEGQQIEQGQKLFTYNNPELSIQGRQLEIDKKVTSLRVEQDKNKISSLKEEIEKAKNEGSPKEVTSPLEEQLRELELQQKTTGLELERNKLRSEELSLKQNELTVSSAIAGVVQMVDKNAGKTNTPGSGIGGTPVIQIASQEPYLITGTLSELQRPLIQPDQPITITAKALANKKWTGKIMTVSQYPTTNEMNQMAAPAMGQSSPNITFYHFKASLDSQEGLAPGFHVSIQVKIDSKKMLVIPRNSIVEKADSKYVFTVKGNKIDKRKISTGMGDGEWVEVVKGIKVGEKLVKQPSSDLLDGMEVNSK
jgi:HlyD family secretion protein